MLDVKVLDVGTAHSTVWDIAINLSSKYFPNIRAQTLYGFHSDDLNHLWWGSAEYFKEGYTDVAKVMLEIYAGNNVLESSKPNILPTVRDFETRFPKLGKYVVLAPFSTMQDNFWSMENWRELIQLISDEEKGIVIVGAPGDFPIANRISGTRVLNACGVSLEMSTYLIKNAIDFVGVDSGPAHIRSLFGEGTVLFGCQYPEVWGYKHMLNIKVGCDINYDHIKDRSCPHSRCTSLARVRAEDILKGLKL